MRNRLSLFPALLALLAGASCSRPSTPSTVSAAARPDPATQSRREVHFSGVVQAVHAVKITVPMIQGQNSSMTITDLVPNGSRVEKDDVIAVFDPAQQQDAAREALAKYEDLGHQAGQRAAENRASAERRAVDLAQANGDLRNAELELGKGPVQSSIDKRESELRAADARAHLASLAKSSAYREKSDLAALRILELQRDRQKVALDRANDNISKLTIRAPLAGMVAHELTYRGNSYGRVQIGDQLYRSYPVASIFQPDQMQVRCSVNEPDIQYLLNAGKSVEIQLDAYPNLRFPAHYVYSSPVASSGIGTSVKSFSAVFQIDKTDSRLLPDLSASVIVPISGATK